MTFFRPYSKALILLLLFSLCLLPHTMPPVEAAARRFDARLVTWERLLYKAQNLFGNVTTEVDLEFLPARLAGNLLIKIPYDEPFKPLGQYIGSITVRSAINPLLGSNNEILNKSLFNLHNVGTLRRIRQLKGKEYWQKTYRFTKSGVYRLRKRPKGPDEVHQKRENWTDIKESFYAYDLSIHGCLQVMDPSTLLYIISLGDLPAEGETLNLCVFNKKQLHQVQLRWCGNQRQQISYQAMFPQNKVVKKEENTEILKISMTSRPLISKKQTAETFSFLGLKGEIEFYLHPNSRIPVQISGRIPYVGRLVFKLNKAWLRPVDSTM